MDKWEYSTLCRELTSDGLKELNALGKEGWEVITEISGRLLLKRKIPSAPTQSVQKPIQNTRNDDYEISF